MNRLTLIMILTLSGCGPPSPPKPIDCTGCHPLVDPAPRLTKQEDSSLYRCANDKQWWEEGCERHFTEQEKENE